MGTNGNHPRAMPSANNGSSIRKAGGVCDSLLDSEVINNNKQKHRTVAWPKLICEICFTWLTCVNHCLLLICYVWAPNCNIVSQEEQSGSYFNLTSSFAWALIHKLFHLLIGNRIMKFVCSLILTKTTLLPNIIIFNSDKYLLYIYIYKKKYLFRP